MDRHSWITTIELGFINVYNFTNLGLSLAGVYDRVEPSLVGAVMTTYAVSDFVLRQIHTNEYGKKDHRGMTEMLIDYPGALYRRYKCWREIREIDAQAREGEVFV